LDSFGYFDQTSAAIPDTTAEAPELPPRLANC
jgi:hypothetical protein